MLFAIFDAVLKRLTVRGSIVGTRMDLQEALQFAADGLIEIEMERQPLEAINEVFDRLREGTVSGRVVLDVLRDPPRARRAGVSGARRPVA